MNTMREVIFYILDAVILIIIAYRLLGFIIKNRKRSLMDTDEAYFSFIKPLVKPIIAWAILEQVMFYYGYEKQVSMMVLTSIAAILIMMNAAQLEKIMNEKNKKNKKDEESET